MIKVRHGNAPYVQLFDQSVLGPSGASQFALNPNTTPGTVGQIIWLRGPRFINTDMAISKVVPIRENLRFKVQGEFLNALNHPNWAVPGSISVLSGGFGRLTTPINNPASGVGPRAIELRANLEF